MGSSRAVVKLTAHSSAESNEEFPQEDWQIILRSAGISPASAKQLNDVNAILLGQPSLRQLPLAERCDVRYLREMIEHNAVPYVHPFFSRYDENCQEPQSSGAQFHSRHSCTVCDWEKPEDLVNILGAGDNPLARLDWASSAINGPRMLMMKKEDLQEQFNLPDEEDVYLYCKALNYYKQLHK